MNTLPMLPFRLGYLKFQVAFLHPTYRLLFFGVCRVCAAGAHAVARYAKLLLFQMRVRAFCTPPPPRKWAGYLKFIFQVAFFYS